MRYLDENIKYLSFEDTLTCCRKCAFNYDLNNMELCPQCKKYYKGIPYPTCIECLPEDKRKAAKEKIEFGKEWASMHEELGIFESMTLGEIVKIIRKEKVIHKTAIDELEKYLIGEMT